MHVTVAVLSVVVMLIPGRDGNSSQPRTDLQIITNVVDCYYVEIHKNAVMVRTCLLLIE